MKRRIDNVRFRVGLAVLAFVFCYAGVIAAIVHTWATSAVYSYGFVVAIVTGYMLWNGARSLGRVDTADFSPNYSMGVPLTLAGAAMLVTGRMGALTSLQEASIAVSLAGLILLVFGDRASRVSTFPVLYLLLGLPIWDAVIARLQPASQILSSTIAVRFLRAAGVPALQNGTFLTMPNLTVEVLRECSGVNQLIAMVVLTLPAGYLLLRGFGRRAVLLAVTIAVAYLSNGARIALIGLMALRGVGNNDRRLHLLEGLATSIVGFVPLLACVSLLSKTEPTSQPRDDSATSSAADERGRRRMRSLAIEYGVLAVVVSAGVVVLFFRPVDVRLTAELRSFPEHIEDWSMAPSEAPFAVPLPAIDDDLLPTAYPSRSGARRFTSVDIDDELVRTYQNASGERVRLYVGYDRYQQDGKALDGEASGLLHAAARPLRLGNADSTAIEINQVVWPQSGDGMFFWYDFNGRIVTNRYAAKAYMLWDAVTRFRTNGAVIMVAWSRPRTADLDSSRRCAMGFVRALLPVLTRYLPT